ncbi:unnamed protein product [Lampetra planeri]
MAAADDDKNIKADTDVRAIPMRGGGPRGPVHRALGGPWPRCAWRRGSGALVAAAAAAAAGPSPMSSSSWRPSPDCASLQLKPREF